MTTVQAGVFAIRACTATYECVLHVQRHDLLTFFAPLQIDASRQDVVSTISTTFQPLFSFQF